MCPGIADQLARLQAFVAAEVVGYDDVAGGKSGNKAVLDPSRESVPIDRSVQHERGDDAVMTQTGEKEPAPAKAGVRVFQWPCGT